MHGHTVARMHGHAFARMHGRTRAHACTGVRAPTCRCACAPACIGAHAPRNARASALAALRDPAAGLQPARGLAPRQPCCSPPAARPPCWQVWFLGKACARKIRGNPHLAKTNHGYDDERGDLHIVLHDHIAYR